MSDICFIFPLKIGYEFDFLREADAMEKIRCFLYANNKKAPVIVPRVIPNMVTRYDSILAFIFISTSTELYLDLVIQDSRSFETFCDLRFYTSQMNPEKFLS